MNGTTRRLTMAQALVEHLINQWTVVDGEEVPLFAGVFGIFGHGNVTCLSEALEGVKDRLPTWRGQNEQSMALAALGYSKAKLRRRLMIATSSIGPGALNMMTAAGTAHANRLPLLFLAGDSFTNRLPDPVLQQVEHYDGPTTTVNDAFRAVTRYWDRITHPAQIIQSLPQAIGTMLDPADCGPAFIALPQDTQEIAFDYPEEFFARRLWSIPRPRPDRDALAGAAEMLKGAERPLVISGGGVRYSGAGSALREFALERKIPVVETVAGKGALVHEDPVHCGPVGIIGSYSANALAERADLILAIGTRLQDFTTGSWTAFAKDARIVCVNAARWDASKHMAHAVVGDALECVRELGEATSGWSLDGSWLEEGKRRFGEWNALLDDRQAPTNAPVPTYAQVVGMVNRAADGADHMVAAAGGIPGEVQKGWRVKAPDTYDLEFGFSCMGYEIAAGWGNAMANKGKGETWVLLGDGAYLMMNSDIYSSVLTGHKMIVVVCDNGGFAVINRLQEFKGTLGFNNLLKDCLIENPDGFPHVDWAAHAASMGAESRHCESLADLRAALEWARTTDRSTVISIATHAFDWTPGDADWDVGVPEVSERGSVKEARAHQESIRAKRRIGV